MRVRKRHQLVDNVGVGIGAHPRSSACAVSCATLLIWAGSSPPMNASNIPLGKVVGLWNPPSCAPFSARHGRNKIHDRLVRYGPVAQLAEHRAFNPRVVGSSPTGPTLWNHWDPRPFRALLPEPPFSGFAHGFSPQLLGIQGGSTHLQRHPGHHRRGPRRRRAYAPHRPHPIPEYPTARRHWLGSKRGPSKTPSLARCGFAPRFGAQTASLHRIRRLFVRPDG